MKPLQPPADLFPEHDTALGGSYQAGRAAGVAAAALGLCAAQVLGILAGRDMIPTAEERDRVFASRDLDELERLMCRAMTVQPGEDLFDSPSA